MMIAGGETIGWVSKGLLLVHASYHGLDRTVLLRALQGKVRIPHVTRVPSWEVTEAFIAANPDFVSADPRKWWWESRRDSQSRVQLMIGLAQELRRREGEEFYLFAKEVREDPAMAARVIPAVGRIKDLLGDDALSRDEKTSRIAGVLRDALGG